MKRYTDILVDFVVALKYKDLPSCVIEQYFGKNLPR